jgi:large subunit ribosomal protein L4
VAQRRNGFGPQPRSYEYHLPKKMFRAALRSALALKLKENQLNIIDAFSLTDHKTKALRRLCLRWDSIEGSCHRQSGESEPVAARPQYGEVDLIPACR